jgi:glycosyltransferase involved in cell wall biosynthesis
MKQGGIRLKRKTANTRNSSQPLMTVITAVYNGAKTIERAINSVISQTWTNIEFIIIDGGSNDRTVEIIKRYENYIDYWISEPDKGIADAFNKGLHKATGDFISFIGCDDWYEPDGVMRIVKEIKPEELIYAGHANLWSNDGRTILKIQKSCPERIFQTMRIAHPATFVSRNLFSSIGEFSTEFKIAMDYDFFLRAKLNGFNTIVVDSVIVNILSGGISHDVIAASREELRIKNFHLGKKIKHFVWYFTYILAWKLISIKKKNFNRSYC